MSQIAPDAPQASNPEASSPETSNPEASNPEASNPKGSAQQTDTQHTRAPAPHAKHPAATDPQRHRVGRTPLGLTLYRFVIRLLSGLAPRLLKKRAAKGKEDPNRLHERLGRPTTPRPPGPLIWLHAVSVGESLMILPLLDALRVERPDAGFLVTTGTVTSAKIMGEKLPHDVIHQYAPLDRVPSVTGFLDHWRPGLGVLAESELWPNLILAAQARGVPLALVNARMTEKSLKTWRRWRASAQRLLGAFAWIGAADTRTHDGLSALAPTSVALTGNLKLAAPPPEPNEALVASIRDHAGPRTLTWLAASTHDGEDEDVLMAHKLVREQRPDALLLIAPRHPQRGPAIAALARSMDQHTALRSTHDLIQEGVSVYVVDTVGEMGSWYALANAVFVAGGWKPDVGGHTPLEPARARRPIFSGPNVANFADLYAQLTEGGGAVFVDTPEALSAALVTLTREQAEAMVVSAESVASAGERVLEETMAGLRPHLPEAPDATA